MYTLKSKIIATSVIALSLLLLAATPVFADSNDRDTNGIRIGVLSQLFTSNDDRDHDHDEDRNENRDERKSEHGTSTHATSSKQFTIEGTVTAVNTNVLTVRGARGAVYTVSTTNASITGFAGTAIPFSSIKVGDKVSVKGTLSGSIIVASKVKDKNDRTGKVFTSLKAGIVTAINGATISLSNFGTNGTTTVTTSSSTKYKVNGSATTSNALSIGSHVLVLGTTTAQAGSSVNASIVVILTEGLHWLKNFWR